ncbi:MerR family transcriptional regulator [Adlercreutzia sp. ZJ176]|nr:MerR family transcriptional regulator [Adlercreutzia sp. ZJ176]
MAREGTYGIKELAKLAGVSARTLRYYDEIGLLVPHRAENGYRIYDTEDAHALQHILLLRRCRIPLSVIASALHEPDFEIGRMLSCHLGDLRRQRSDLDETISIVQRAVEGLEAFEAMDDKQRFEQLKRDSVALFEGEYGEEARELYGDDAIDASNERMLGMSREAWDAKEGLEQRIKDALKEAMDTGDPRSSLSRTVAEMHARWIRLHWGDDAYTPEAHKSLAEGYLLDPRFVAYYDGACGEGATEFLCSIIKENVAA